MANIKEYSLGDICSIRKGLSFKESHYLKSGTPVLKKGNIKFGKVNNENLFYCDERDHKVLDTHRVRYGDVVITNLAPEAGRIGINLTDTEFILCGEVFKLDPNPRILDRKYLYYFLMNFPHRVEQLLTSSNVVRLRASSIEKFKIRVPDLETQKNIVRQLDTFRELRGELRGELRMRKQQGVYYRDKIMSDLKGCVGK